MSNSKNIFASVVKPTLVLFITCLLVTLAVAGTNEITAEQIDAINQQRLNESMQSVIPADEYEEIDVEAEDASIYKALQDSETLGYIFITDAKGYGGDVSVMTGIQDGSIIAVEIVDCSNETPGLGQNAKNPEFTEQYEGKTAPPSLVKGTDPQDNEVKALTGATVTSHAVTEAVSEALELYSSLSEKEAG